MSYSSASESPGSSPGGRREVHGLAERLQHLSMARVREEHDGKQLASVVHDVPADTLAGACVVSFARGRDDHFVTDVSGKCVLSRRPVVLCVHDASGCEWVPVRAANGERGDGFVLVVDTDDGVVDVARFELYDDRVAFCPMTPGRVVGESAHKPSMSALVWSRDHPQKVRDALAAVQTSNDARFYTPEHEVVIGRAVPELYVAVRTVDGERAADSTQRAAAAAWERLCAFLEEMRDVVREGIERHNRTELVSADGGVSGEA
jgi:hypothetical protein